MKDEHFMRVWNEGHDHFSADITHGLKWLATPFRRLGERIALHLRDVDRTSESSGDFVWRKGTVAPVIDYRQTQDGEARPASGWRKRSNGAGRIGRRRRTVERGTSAVRCLAASGRGMYQCPGIRLLRCVLS